MELSMWSDKCDVAQLTNNMDRVQILVNNFSIKDTKWCFFFLKNYKPWRKNSRIIFFDAEFVKYTFHCVS